MRATIEWLTASGALYAPGAEKSGTAHLEHYPARFRIWGEGPPLILVPGLAGGMNLVGPLARVLSRHYQVISYQLRGEDDSFTLRRQFGLEEMADDLGELIDWFGLERPAVMGVSFGGVVALNLALRRPTQMSSLVLQGVGPRFEPGLLQRVAGLVLSRYPLPADNPFVNQFFNLFFGGKQQPGPLLDFVTWQCWQTDQSVMAHRFKLVEKAEFCGQLGGMKVPTLALAGDRDLFVSALGLRELTNALPNGQGVQLPNCGHLGFVTHPERIAEEVCRFLSHQEGDEPRAADAIG